MVAEQGILLKNEEAGETEKEQQVYMFAKTKEFRDTNKQGQRELELIIKSNSKNFGSTVMLGLRLRFTDYNEF